MICPECRADVDMFVQIPQLDPAAPLILICPSCRWWGESCDEPMPKSRFPEGAEL